MATASRRRSKQDSRYTSRIALVLVREGIGAGTLDRLERWLSEQLQAIVKQNPSFLTRFEVQIAWDTRPHRKPK